MHTPLCEYGASKLFCGIGSTSRSYVHTTSPCTSWILKRDGESRGRGTRVRKMDKERPNKMDGAEKGKSTEVYGVSELSLILPSESTDSSRTKI